ncbi:hypothetical protein Nepgr_006545 [Nepenthes gracilis]|uniref:Uncharacterized protein n=1 Tax=Nepenthes gracilis TaxID=150966 RepID=A0AAD3S5C7_NEPGR|nr:hypothetical protein Nepgr_006545 [Nepenthes gracilis]
MRLRVILFVNGSWMPPTISSSKREELATTGGSLCKMVRESNGVVIPRLSATMLYGGCSPVSLSLSWCLGVPFVHEAVVGGIARFDGVDIVGAMALVFVPLSLPAVSLSCGIVGFYATFSNLLIAELVELVICRQLPFHGVAFAGCLEHRMTPGCELQLLVVSCLMRRGAWILFFALVEGGAAVLIPQSPSPSSDGYSSLGSHEDSGRSILPLSTSHPNRRSISLHFSNNPPLPATHIPLAAVDSTSDNLKAEANITQLASLVASIISSSANNQLSLYQPSGRILSAPTVDSTKSAHKEYSQRDFYHTKAGSDSTVKISNQFEVLHFDEEAENCKISDEVDLLRDQVVGESVMTHAKIFQIKEDKTSMEQEDLHNPSILGTAPAIKSIAGFRTSLTQAPDSLIIFLLLVDEKTVKLYVALLSSDGMDAILGNQSCVQLETGLQKCSLFQQGGIVEKHQKVADHNIVSYVDILKRGINSNDAAEPGSCATHMECAGRGERVDCKSPPQEMTEQNLGGEKYEAIWPVSSQVEVCVAVDLIGNCGVNQLWTVAKRQNAIYHGVIDREHVHPILNAISNDDKSLMGNRDGLSNSSLPSAVRGEKGNCKYSPQGLADQVIAPPQSD